MTESQLPAAAAAQKFGTLIPNRIFGELFFQSLHLHFSFWWEELIQNCEGWKEVCVKFLCDGG